MSDFSQLILRFIGPFSSVFGSRIKVWTKKIADLLEELEKLK